MDTRKRLGVAFLWHMHQPFYKDLLGGKYLMPWARLHAVKDYLPMALLAERHDVKTSFNLVPSLLEQIEDYANGGATDIFLDLTVKKASALEPEEKAEILKNFFKVNFKRFIEPSARYSELLLKKGVRPLSAAASKNVIKSFSAQDLLDLQVLFSLSWFHSLLIDEDTNLKAIVEKGKSFTGRPSIKTNDGDKSRRTAA